MKATITDPVRAVINTAQRFVGNLEYPKNSNHGITPDFCNWWVIKDMRPFPMGGGGAPWCATFVSTIGRLALGIAWPIPMTSDVTKLAEWAMGELAYLKRPPIEDVKAGDIFLVPNSANTDWTHTGFITYVDKTNDSVLTIEGNTDGSGSREGNGVYERTRLIQSIDTINWIDKLELETK